MIPFSYRILAAMKRKVKLQKGRASFACTFWGNQLKNIHLKKQMDCFEINFEPLDFEWPSTKIVQIIQAYKKWQ